MTDSHIPAFQSSPFGNLISEVTVTRLVVDTAGDIAGVEIRDLSRDLKILVLGCISLLAVAFTNHPWFLLLSRSAAFPRGIGNDHDLVGRFFMEHQGPKFNGQVRTGWRNFNSYQLIGNRSVLRGV